MKAAKICHQISKVYEESAFSCGLVWQWMKAFKEMHPKERNVRPSIITDDFSQKVGDKMRENIHFHISFLSNEFSEVSRSEVYKLATENFNYRMLRSS